MDTTPSEPKAAASSTLRGNAPRYRLKPRDWLQFFYLVAAVRFWSDVSEASARRLLRASFVYLPAILALLLLNPTPA